MSTFIQEILNRRLHIEGRGRLCAAIIWMLISLVTLNSISLLHAGEVVLSNGLIIDGNPVPIQGLTKAAIGQTQTELTVYPILMIDTGLKRVFVPDNFAEEINRDVNLSKYVTFNLDQKPAVGRPMLASVGSFADKSIFDKFGRRTVKLQTAEKPIDVIQGIRRITPRYVRVTSLSHVWDHGIATTSIDPPILDAIIRQVTDQNDPNDRLAVARFYLQARQYIQADHELESIERDFPELAGRVEEVGLDLRHLWAKQLLDELQNRREAGQHRLAYAAAKKFPRKKMSASVVRRVDEIIDEYQDAVTRMHTAAEMLAVLQAQITDPEQVAKLAPLRSSVRNGLKFESLDRLDAFLKLADDNNIPANEKLALAYSGWIVGGENAVTDLSQALRYWEARDLVMQYLRTPVPLSRKSLLGKIESIEGISPKVVEQMIPHLPPLRETFGVRAGQSFQVTSREPATEPVSYSVILPQEYSPDHAYPMIVGLRPAERTIKNEADWWGVVRKHAGDPGVPGQSQRRGYIVIAPEYMPPQTSQYDYSSQSHQKVLSAIRDARKRFSVDSDRIFLAGHGMGGDAAFDIGMSHPDMFAGVIPIAGICDHYCKYYWQNTKLDLMPKQVPAMKTLPFYIVGGELDRDSLERNSKIINQMMIYNYDVTYSEYQGRGYESFYEEIHDLFDWMAFQKRHRHSTNFTMRVLRPTDTRFFWLQSDGIPFSPVNILNTNGSNNRLRGRATPKTINARATTGNSIYIRSQAKLSTIWLSPEFISFDERVRIYNNARQIYNEIPEPEIEVMLEDLYTRGDRQKLYSVKVECDRNTCSD